jgi:DNA-binding NtrC family response regulator
LLGHDWPGNIREMENVIEGAKILAPSPVVTAAGFAASMWFT